MLQCGLGLSPGLSFQGAHGTGESGLMVEPLVLEILDEAHQCLALSRFARQKAVSVDLEAAGIGLPSRPAEGVDRRTHLDIDETRLRQHLFPAFTRKATGNSGSPQIDVSHRGLGHRCSIGEIGEL